MVRICSLSSAALSKSLWSAPFISRYDRNCRGEEAVMTFQRYKFQGMITRTPRVAAAIDAPDDTDTVTWNLPPGQMRRIVVRGEHHDTRGSHFFSALVAANDDGS